MLTSTPLRHFPEATALKPLPERKHGKHNVWRPFSGPKKDETHHELPEVLPKDDPLHDVLGHRNHRRVGGLVRIERPHRFLCCGLGRRMWLCRKGLGFSTRQT